MSERGGRKGRSEEKKRNEKRRYRASESKGKREKTWNEVQISPSSI